MPSDSLRTSRGRFAGTPTAGKRSKYRNPTNQEVDLRADRGLAISGSSWVLCAQHGIVPVVAFSHNRMRLGCGCSRSGSCPRTQQHGEFAL
jgi:hypothetical protein